MKELIDYLLTGIQIAIALIVVIGFVATAFKSGGFEGHEDRTGGHD